jgi:hypothetical protein
MAHPEVVLPVLAIVAMIALITLGRFKGIRDARRRSPATADDPVAKLGDRIARLEQAVDAIAIEMERVGESQRFLTKILAERPTAPKEIS